MSEAKHTPGPWTFHAGDALTGQIHSANGIVGTCYYRDTDGRLMAAAPDLLAACEAALPLLFLLGAKMPGEKQIGETFEIVKDAIAKARGQ